jgi:hypothetical protein
MKVGSLVTVYDDSTNGEVSYVSSVEEAFDKECVVQVIRMHGSGETTVYSPEQNCTFNIHSCDLTPATLSEVKAALIQHSWKVNPVICCDIALGDAMPEFPTPKILESSEGIHNYEKDIFGYTEDDDDDDDDL